MKITLLGHTLTLAPPQHVLMLEVRREHAPIFKILHATGYESDDEFELISESPVETFSSGDEISLRAVIPELYLRTIPLLHTIDLRALPGEYRVVPFGAGEQFSFESGSPYVIVVLSEVLLEVEVVAE